MGAESEAGPNRLTEALLSPTSRLGLQQLQLVRGPHRILLTAQDLTFLQRTPSRRVGGQTRAGWAGRQRGRLGLAS